MSAEAETPQKEKETWPELSLEYRRVLGVLVEKAKTTPDSYPMSMNAVLTGCNQKSNRDPVTNLSDFDVEEALLTLQKLSLTIRITGSGRVERWRHNIYEAWKVDKVEAAVLAELLLRGPQTLGELRSRANRMEEIADLEQLRTILKNLTQRNMVLFLIPESKRGATVTHNFYPAAEQEALKKQYSSRAAVSEAPPTEIVSSTPPPPPAHEEKFTHLETTLQEAKSDIAELRKQHEEMEKVVAQLRQELQALKQSLGES